MAQTGSGLRPNFKPGSGEDITDWPGIPVPATKPADLASYFTALTLSSALTSAAIAVNTFRVAPFVVNHDTVLRRLRGRTSGAVAAGTSLRYGIYAAHPDTFRPRDLVWQSGVIDITGIANAEYAIDDAAEIALLRNRLYWVALHSDLVNAPGLWGGAATGQNRELRAIIGRDIGNIAADALYLYRQPHGSFAALPDPWPSELAWTVANNNGAPLMWASPFPA